MGSKRKRQAPEVEASLPATAAPTAKKARKSERSEKSKSKHDKHEEINSKTRKEPERVVVPFVENPRGQDLKAEVKLYDLLSSEDAAERQSAAVGIVEGLFGGEGVVEGEDGQEFKGVSSATLQRHLERRLFRGLASGRKGARIGFSIVLAEVLGKLFGGKNKKETAGGEEEGEGNYQELGFEKVVGILVAKTKPEGDLSGQEEKDHHLGLLFGLQSFVRAKILFGDEWEVRWSIILDSLLRLAEKKSWIREECGWVIMEALDQMTLQEQAEMTIRKLVEAGLASSPEGVGIWLKARSRFPDMRLPSKPWGLNGDPLQHLKDLALALKESSKAGDGNAKQSGNWNPKLHYVWDAVMGRYIQRAEDGDESVKSDFRAFWKVAVDDSLFSESASRERKFWGFLLFQKMLQDASDHVEIFKSIFSANLVRCLINQLSKEDRFLNRAADKSIKTILRVVEAKPHTATIVLKNLVSKNGMYNFDRVTKSKTIDKILTIITGFSGKEAEKAVETLLSGVVSLGAEETKEAEANRQLFGDHLLSLIRRSDFSNDAIDHSWIKKTALPTLAKLAYCTEDPKCTPPLSEKSRTLFRERLSSSLAHLISFPKGFSYPTELLQTFKPDALDMDEDVEATKDKAFATMEKLLKKSKKASEETKGHLQALALLYALVIFQVYNGEADAVSVLDELEICYEKLVRGKETGDSEVEASEVLVEILLSFASKPSALLSKTAQHVFYAFSGEISSGGLKLMTDILEKGESLRGQQELFDQDQDEMDIDEGDEDDDSELDSDVEVVDVHDDDGEPNSDDDSEEDEDEEEDPNDIENQKLDAALALALGTHPLTHDPTAPSSDSDSDASMSDSEMMALDSKLVEIFKQRKKLPNKKQEKKDAKETMVNFKSRVLDLLAIYVKEQASNPIAYQLLLPLLSLIRRTNNKGLMDKAHGVIVAFATASRKGRKEASSDPSSSSSSSSSTTKNVDVEEQIQLLKAIHEEAAKDPSQAYAKAASTASLLIASHLLRLDKKGLFRRVAEVYLETEVACIEGGRGGRVHACFFHEYVNWFQSHCG